MSWARRWGPAGMWAALIWWSSSTTPSASGGWWANLLSALPRDLPWDKLVHALSFAVLAVLLERALQFPRGPRRWLAPLLAAGWGAVDECHQWFVPGRVADPLDWLADVFGAWTAPFALRSLRQSHRERQRSDA